MFGTGVAAVMRWLAGRRLWMVGLSVVGLALTAIPAAAEASTTLDCSGATIYVAQRPTSHSNSTNGVVYALAASTVGSGTATLTQVTSLPGGSYPNALGMSANGFYAVDQTGNSGSANVWVYDASSGTWTAYPGSGGDPSLFVAGAVDPANGIYYYAQYASGTSSSPGTATLYGFNTNTDTAIPGAVATFDLPDGPGTASQNGDLTFDGAGNLYILASDGSTRGLGVIKAASVPTTGNDTTLTDTTLSSVSDSSTYNGIAFDNLGRLYLEGSNNGTYGVTQVDPNNGAVLAGPTPYSANAQSAPDVDLASCANIPTLSAQLNVSGRVNPTDQFDLSITGGTITQGNTATTSGSSTGVQPEVAGPVIASSGTTYTFTETGVGGTDMSDYHTTYSCEDTANGDTVLTSGTGSSFQLTFPTVTLGQSTPPPDVVCSFASTPEADLALSDSVTPSTAPHGTDVTYTLTAANGGPDSATNAEVVDTLPAGVNVVSVTPSQGSCSGSGVSCDLGTLADGADATVTVVASVTASSGTLTDAAAVSADQYDPNTANNSASASFTASPSADMALSDSVTPSTAPHGTDVTYTLTATNNGPDSATNAQLSDTLPAGVTVVSVTPSQGSCSGSGVSCDLGTLADGADATVTVVASVTANSGTLTDAASVSADQYDPNTANNSASASFTASPSADMALTDSVTPSTAPDGSEVTYTLKSTNEGPDSATNADVEDTLPAGVTIVSVTPSQGSCSGSGVDCNLGTIANGANATVTVVASVTANSGTLTDAASVSADQYDPNTANNSASASFTAAPAANLAITDTASPTTVDAGGLVTYTLTVTNDGPDAATDTQVSDTLPAGVTVVSATPSQGTCAANATSCSLGTIANGATAQITIVVRVPATSSGSLSNGATVSAQQVDPTSSNNSVTTAVQVLPAAQPPASPPSAPQPAASQPAASQPAASQPAVTAVDMRPRLKLTESFDRRFVEAGSPVGLTLKVSNPTLSRLANVTVCARLPLGLGYLHSARRPKFIDGRPCWSLVHLGAHRSVSIKLALRALRGTVGKLAAPAIASAANVGAAHARRQVTVLPASDSAEAPVTG